MEAKDFAERFTSYRRDNGLTQEDVAEHLGITKAAVSKWECGHSFPDMSLMPEIASLFTISLDDLFGYSTFMDQSKINEVSQQSILMFATEPEKAMEYVRAQAKAHWSCPGLLRALALAVYSQIPQKPGSDKTPLEGEAFFYASEVERLFERTVQLDGARAISDVVPYATVLQMLGKGQMAKALIEPMVSQEPNLASLSFAQLLEKQGDRTEAIRVLQRGLLFSLLETASLLQALASMYDGDEERLAAVLDLGERLIADPEYISLSPVMMPSLTMVAAESAAQHGNQIEALKRLRKFAESLDACCEFLEHPKNPVLFDEVKDLMWQEDGPELQSARRDSVQTLRLSYADGLTNKKVWEPFATNAEFEEIVSTVKGAEYA